MSPRQIYENIQIVTGHTVMSGLYQEPDGLVAIESGQIVYAGATSRYDGDRGGAMDMEGALCLPGLVACHNPCLWAGQHSHSSELSPADHQVLMKDIVAATRQADDETLVAQVAERTAALARSGVTSCELKSGFGGDPETELRFAGLLSAFAANTPMRTRLTLAIGHRFPDDADPYEVLEEIERVHLPAVHQMSSISAIEVYCDEVAGLDLDSCSTILELFYRKKTPSRVACDRFEDSAGATLPASFYSRCATFLNRTDELDLQSLATVGTVAVVVPETLRTDAEPVLPDLSVIRENGGRIALAPLAGPESGPADMLQVLRMGRRELGLTHEETLAAGTTHPAKALGLSEEAGEIAAGRPADLSFFSAGSLEHLLEDETTRCISIIRSGHFTRH